MTFQLGQTSDAPSGIIPIIIIIIIVVIIVVILIFIYLRLTREKRKIVRKIVKQEIEVVKIDKLMKSFDDWEKEGKGKKS